MESAGSGLVRLELKYCERCGALWLRRKGSEVVYCASCAQAILELPMAEDIDGVALTEVDVAVSDSAFWTEGGNA